MNIQYDQQKLAEVARKNNLKFVILHGSYADGKNQEGSDLDIAVVGNSPMSFDDQLKLYDGISDIFPDRIDRDLDLKTLDKVDPFFRYEVVRKGVLLYGDPTAYEEYKLYVQRAYDDAKPLMELERQLIQKYQKHLNVIAEEYAQS